MIEGDKQKNVNSFQLEKAITSIYQKIDTVEEDRRARYEAKLRKALTDMRNSLRVVIQAYINNQVEVHFV